MICKWIVWPFPPRLSKPCIKNKYTWGKFSLWMLPRGLNVSAVQWLGACWSWCKGNLCHRRDQQWEALLFKTAMMAASSQQSSWRKMANMFCKYCIVQFCLNAFALKFCTWVFKSYKGVMIGWSLLTQCKIWICI